MLLREMDVELNEFGEYRSFCSIRSLGSEKKTQRVRNLNVCLSIV